MPTNKIVLGFVGDLAAGKGTICKYLKDKYGTESYRFSTMLRDILKRVYIENTRENLQQLSTILRANFGQDLMSKVIAEDVKNDPKEIVAVEGIRRPTDITYLEKNPGFHLIYITADPKVRWERLVKRKENPGDDKKTFEEFLKDEQAEADRMIKELGKKAEYTINNDGNFENFYKQMEDILKSVRNAG
jgi:dephospho-CoA kinase